MSAQTRQQQRRGPVRGTRGDYIGVTSDGVRIMRPPKGPCNLTDKQVRQVVEDLRHAVAAARHDREPQDVE